jgi:hypothetical protein
MEFYMLEYIALGIIVFVVITLFYGIIVIHDIPYEIAKHRNHPQQDALHVAGWVSLFTLHVLWPFLWIWAMLYKEDRGWGFSKGVKPGESDKSKTDKKLLALQNRIELLEQQIVSQNKIINGEVFEQQKVQSSDINIATEHREADTLITEGDK